MLFRKILLISGYKALPAPIVHKRFRREDALSLDGFTKFYEPVIAFFKSIFGLDSEGDFSLQSIFGDEKGTEFFGTLFKGQENKKIKKQPSEEGKHSEEEEKGEEEEEQDEPKKENSDGFLGIVPL